MPGKGDPSDRGQFATVVGIVLTFAVFLMAFGLLPPIRWPEPGRRVPATPDLIRAESCMRKAMRAIREAKQESGLRAGGGAAGPNDGLLGSEWTPLVTTLGSLESKRLAWSPAWAPVLAEEMLARGARRGDLAAASFSGSFPGLNIATVCACQALGLKLVAFSSVTASTFGATDPGFTWPEMEALLARRGIIDEVSVAVSVGGDHDSARDLDDEGRRLAESIAERTAAELGATWLRASSLEDAIDSRLRLLDQAAAGRRLRFFVNVGGTAASLGTSPAILRLKSGWLPPRPFDPGPGRGLVARMIERGVPVLHLLNVRDLAARWGVL